MRDFVRHAFGTASVTEGGVWIVTFWQEYRSQGWCCVGGRGGAWSSGKWGRNTSYRDLKRKASDCTGSWVMARDEAM
jgi:hypothetical protein